MLLRPFRRPSVSISEKIGVRSLRALRLDTLSGKVLLLAVLAALVTALAMTLILSGGSQRSLGDRVGLELRAASSDAAREIDVWLDQRVFDLRLRASPYVVSDNLARAAGAEPLRLLFAYATISTRSVRTLRRTMASPSAAATVRC